VAGPGASGKARGRPLARLQPGNLKLADWHVHVKVKGPRLRHKTSGEVKGPTY